MLFYFDNAIWNVNKTYSIFDFAKWNIVNIYLICNRYWDTEKKKNCAFSMACDIVWKLINDFKVSFVAWTNDKCNDKLKN